MLRKCLFGIVATMLLIGTLWVVLEPRYASSWSNGGFSSDPAHPVYGTHDWIAQHALDWLPSNEKQDIVNNMAAFLYGTELPDNGVAPDGIGDAALHHFYYWSNGNIQDDASAVRARTEYDKALDYRQSNDTAMSVKTLGIMSHYIVDLSVFGHVMATATDWGEEVHHSDYETYVNDRTDNYADEFNSYLHYDGSLDFVSAYDAARLLAENTTFGVDGSYMCVWMDQNYNWANPAFKNRAGESLNLAVNYLADVLHSFYALAYVHLSPTNVNKLVNMTFVVDVKIGALDCKYAEAKLSYNTSILHCRGISGASYESIATTEPLGYVRFWNLYSSPISGDLTLASLELKCTDLGECSLHLYETNLTESSGNPIPHDSQDGHSLIAEAITWALTINTGGVDHAVTVLSSYVVSNENLNPTLRQLGFHIEAPTDGFCNVTVPKTLMSGAVAVYLHDTPTPSIMTWNATHTYIYFTSTQLSDDVKIVGEYVVAIPGDVNHDGIVNILDAITMGNHFLEHYP